jgi:hypothetical protein
MGPLALTEGPLSFLIPHHKAAQKRIRRVSNQTSITIQPEVQGTFHSPSHPSPVFPTLLAIPSDVARRRQLKTLLAPPILLIPQPSRGLPAKRGPMLQCFPIIFSPEGYRWPGPSAPPHPSPFSIPPPLIFLTPVASHPPPNESAACALSPNPI